MHHPALIDPTAYAELAALSSSVQVSRAVAAALGVREKPGQALLDTLTAFLQAKRMLILLDNCEHLLAACAELADRLLEWEELAVSDVGAEMDRAGDRPAEDVEVGAGV